MLTYDEAAYCGVEVALDKSLMLTCFDKKSRIIKFIQSEE